jgi:hypothetical protein
MMIMKMKMKKVTGNYYGMRNSVLEWARRHGPRTNGVMSPISPHTAATMTIGCAVAVLCDTRTSAGTGAVVSNFVANMTNHSGIPPFGVQAVCHVGGRYTQCNRLR